MSKITRDVRVVKTPRPWPVPLPDDDPLDWSVSDEAVFASLSDGRTAVLPCRPGVDGYMISPRMACVIAYGSLRELPLR